ncbi:MAG TPA: hypothetical protein VFQ53_37635 [Kofleriaceae bacterium]|nr:hypothetical protein [Kofleriaceae bacterium]
MLIARSSPECHLYIELHPCTCGESELRTKHHLASSDDGLVAVYEGTCPRCGAERRFDLVLDPEIPPGDKFGGDRPSKIIDAGQFLAVADAAAKAVPANTSALDGPARQRARWLMTRAANAIEEVLKFIPPGADRVPAEALFTAAGKEVYLAEPGRFRKLRLEAVLGVYRDVVKEL